MAKGPFAGSNFTGIVPTPSTSDSWGGTKNGVSITDGQKGSPWPETGISEVTTVKMDDVEGAEDKLHADFSGSGIVASPANKKINSGW